MKALLEVRDLTKVFKIYENSFDRLKEIFTKRSYHKEFIANKNITFSLFEKETLGIVGLNGAGKSTLLKLIAGVLEPTSGEIVRRGRVTALLELGTGFNPELSGRENIFLNATLIGMSSLEIKRKIDKIIQFSELEEYIDEPLHTYSSGMKMRLAFSIAIFSEPEILIVDEALAVGDAHFQQKCTRALKRRKEKAMGIIYVSHDLNSLKILCDRMLLLHKGEVIKKGSPEEVINSYNFLIAKMNEKEEKKILKKENSYGTFDAKIEEVKLIGEKSKSDVISSGEIAKIFVKIRAYKDIKDVTVGIAIRDKFAQDIFGTNTYYHDICINLKKDKRYICVFDMKMNIGVGKYTITAALHTNENHIENCFHWIDNASEFEVAGFLGKPFVGICRLEPKIEIRELTYE